MQGAREQQALDLHAMDGLAQTLGDDAQRAYVAWRSAYRSWRIAEHAQCEHSARHAVKLVDRVLATRTRNPGPAGADEGLHELRLLSLRMAGNAVMNQGRLDEAQVVLQHALNEARTRGLLKPQGYCLNSLGILAERQDDRVRALEVFREALNITRQVGNRRSEAIQLGNVGLQYLALGDLSAAQRELDEALRLVRQNGDRALECPFLCGLSALTLWQGDGDGALAVARSALDVAKAVQARDWVSSASVCLADAEAARGQLVTAANVYAEGCALAVEVGSGWRFDASAGLANLLLAQGDINGALHALQPLLLPADGRVEERAVDQAAPSSKPTADGTAAFGFPGAEWPRKIELTIHRVLAAAGDPRAAAWLQYVHDTLMAQADTITDAALRQMFLTNIPHHRDIAVLWKAHCAQRTS
jgi:tetratricopeptide (TPR) repeat protein